MNTQELNRLDFYSSLANNSIPKAEEKPPPKKPAIDLNDVNAVATRWVDDHGDYLFNFALGQLRDPNLAEDLVQETFLAALKSQNNFSGRSSERTWLVGILRHKIYDHLRMARR